MRILEAIREVAWNRRMRKLQRGKVWGVKAIKVTYR